MKRASLWAFVSLMLIVVDRAILYGGTLPQGHQGIASKYPRDLGIQNDPAVLFAENFESGRLGTWRRSRDKSGNGRSEATSHPDDVFDGRYAYKCLVPRLGEGYASLTRKIEPPQERLHVRVYWRLQPDFNVRGNHGWGFAGTRGKRMSFGAGRRADGRNKFLFTMDDNTRNLALYVYHPDQRGGYGDKFRTGFQFQPGRWYCVEVMQKINTIGQKDGELALWIDGKLVKHWPGMRFRDIPELQIKHLYLMFYTHDNRQPNTYVCYDNVVVARSYIGPMVQKKLARAKAGGALLPLDFFPPARQRPVLPNDPLVNVRDALEKAAAVARRGEFPTAMRALQEIAAREKDEVARALIALRVRGLKEAGALRQTIRKGLRTQGSKTVYMDLAGSPMRARLVAVDEETVRFEAAGSEIRMPWQKIGPSRVAAIAAKYTPDTDTEGQLRLACLYLALGQPELAKSMLEKARAAGASAETVALLQKAVP